MTVLAACEAMRSMEWLLIARENDRVVVAEAQEILISALSTSESLAIELQKARSIGDQRKHAMPEAKAALPLPLDAGMAAELASCKVELETAKLQLDETRGELARWMQVAQGIPAPTALSE